MPLEDTGSGGDITPTVSPDVFDHNFGPNYTILYSPENTPGGYYFDGGLGSDQYTGYQGDPGNFGGYDSNLSLADQLNTTNSIGGDPAYAQYACAQAIDGGNLAAPVQYIEQKAQVIAAAAPANAGGNPAVGAAEIASPASGLRTSRRQGQPRGWGRRNCKQPRRRHGAHSHGSRRGPGHDSCCARGGGRFGWYCRCRWNRR